MLSQKSILFKTFYILVIIGFFTATIYAQSKTPYEKRKDELSLQLFKQLGVSQSQINRAKEMGEIESLFMIGGIMQKLNTMEGLVLLERYSKALKNAEELKTEVDFKKERLKKEAEERKKQIAQEAQDEKDRQEEAVAQEKQQLEQLEQERKEQERIYNNSDYVQIKKEVKEKFEKWLEKGEFEKTDIFKERIVNKDLVFDSICHQVITKRIEYKASNFSTNIELQTYNADNESYPVKITLDGKYFLDTLQIKLSNAEQFKTNMSYAGRISLPKGEGNWCLRENYLFPLKVNLPSAYIEIKVPITKKFTLLNLSSDELNLSNYNQEELKYEFANFEAKREKRIQEINTQKYKEHIANAEKSIENKKYVIALNYYEEASKIENTTDLNAKIDSLKQITNKIENNYKEITDAEFYIHSNYQIQINKTEELILKLTDKNKKANTNFNMAIDYIKNKYKANDELIATDISKEKENLVWTPKEENIYNAFIEKKKHLRTWLQFNNAVSILVNDKELKVLKSEENPEILIQKVLSK